MSTLFAFDIMVDEDVSETVTIKASVAFVKVWKEHFDDMELILITNNMMRINKLKTVAKTEPNCDCLEDSAMMTKLPVLSSYCNSGPDALI